ncbi:hypothetical protein F2P81_011016 [Scophthalmus maximus]|uniref:Uncharacterized protein n=1 Tax=Scophthalmus maximus TaxID=52904 RepID=A0A6A4SXA2_SCOMX|nr:hypothetical protein F2P81_011016 [Scophthalmus maximus]
MRWNRWKTFKSGKLLGRLRESGVGLLEVWKFWRKLSRTERATVVIIAAADKHALVFNYQVFTLPSCTSISPTPPHPKKMKKSDTHCGPTLLTRVNRAMICAWRSRPVIGDAERGVCERSGCETGRFRVKRSPVQQRVHTSHCAFHRTSSRDVGVQPERRAGDG